MPTLTMTKGLPGSGKTTWAKAQNAKRINKDDLRAMLDNAKWSKPNEAFIIKARNTLVTLAIGEGHDVIVDDTNLAPKHEAELRRIAEVFHVDFLIKDFTDVPLKECIRRDLLRPASVGKDVIVQMSRQLKKVDVAQYLPDPSLPKAIICDIDGTLAHMDGRSPYDYSKVHTDKVDENIKGILQHYWDSRSPQDEDLATTIILLSGRIDDCKEQTEAWLKENDVKYDFLFMRASGDSREDSIIKREIFDEHIANRYNVQFVLDDRNRVVDMWRDMGLKCLQVAEGDF